MSSRLLTAPNGPHGTAKQAIFNEHQAATIQTHGRLGEPARPTIHAGLASHAYSRGALRAGRPDSAAGTIARGPKGPSVVRGREEPDRQRGAARNPAKPAATAAASSTNRPTRSIPRSSIAATRRRRRKRPLGSEFNVVGTMRVPTGAFAIRAGYSGQRPSRSPSRSPSPGQCPGVRSRSSSSIGPTGQSLAELLARWADNAGSIGLISPGRCPGLGELSDLRPEPIDSRCPVAREPGHTRATRNAGRLPPRGGRGRIIDVLDQL